MPDELLHGRFSQGRRDPPPTRAIDFHPSPRPPVPDGDLELYAGRWVAVRGGRVVLDANRYDALLAMRASRPFDQLDTIRHLPPSGAGLRL